MCIVTNTHMYILTFCNYTYVLLIVALRITTYVDDTIYKIIRMYISEPFRWVMAWRDMIPIHHFVALLERHFFPKWHQVTNTNALVLCNNVLSIITQVFSRWLTNQPNYDEVVQW